ncbi:hypothetical protein ACHAQH_001118 [Verticillium albo-atrum]
MPPKVSSRGRKRAPPVASDASSQLEPPALPQDVNEELSFGDQVQSTPRPPGRPTNNKPISQSASVTKAQPQRRGRPPGTKNQQPSNSNRVGKDDELADESVDTPGTASKGQRTGVLSDSLKDAAEEEAAAENATPKLDQQGRKRKRGRSARAEAVEEPTEQEVEPQEPTQSKKRKRGRPAVEEAEDAQDEPSDARPQRKHKKHPSTTTEQPWANESDPPAKKARGRPRKSDVPAPSDPLSQTKSRGRPRTSNISITEAQPSKPKSKTSRPSIEASISQSAPKKRRVTEDTATNDLPAPPKPSVRYRHIGTKPASIPRSKIEATWTPLPASSIAIATSLIHLAERPVLQRLATNTKRRDHAAFALRTVSHNLARKLARRFPFPPAANSSTRARSAAARDTDPRDEELDYERCLDAVKALERTQTGLLHGNALLRAEVAREEAALEKEHAELDALEANARSEVRRLREDMRKTHPLVPDGRGTPAAGAPVPDETLHVADAPPPGLFQDIDVPGLQGIGARVGSHMESLRANLQPVEHVVPEIARSRAALRDVLAQHLEPGQFQEVLLG